MAKRTIPKPVIPSGFVPLLGAWRKIAVVEAMAALRKKNSQLPDLSEECMEAVSSYRARLSSYKNAFHAHQAWESSFMLGSEWQGPGPEPITPQKPTSRPEIVDFLNALQIAGTSIEQFEYLVRHRIETEAIPAFVVSNDGILRRLKRSDFLSRAGQSIFSSGRYGDFSKGRVSEPVVLKESDVQPALNPERATIKAETECSRWLEEKMRLGSTPDKSKDNYRQEAVKLFQVGTKAFNRAWRNAVVNTGNEKWSKPGRKPQRKS